MKKVFVFKILTMVILLTFMVTASFAANSGGYRNGSGNGGQRGSEATEDNTSQIEQPADSTNETTKGHGGDSASSGESGNSNAGSGGSGGNTGGSGGAVELTVIADNLAPGKEATIMIEKEIDGEMVYYEDVTSDHAVVFHIPFGGTCLVTGGMVPGYITPPSVEVVLTQLNGILSVTEHLDYRPGQFSVTKVRIDQSDMHILKGYTVQLTATVTPLNANNQEVHWMVSGGSGATVDADGLVTAEAHGSVTVTAYSDEDEGIEDTCEIMVGEIMSIDAPVPNPLEVNTGEEFQLPSMLEASVTYPDGPRREMVDIDWDGVGPSNNVIIYESTPATREYIGRSLGTDYTVTQNVDVEGETIIPATDVILSHHATDLYVSEQSVNNETLVISVVEVTPSGAHLGALKWVCVAAGGEISDVVSIIATGTDSVTIRGEKVGTATLLAYLETDTGRNVLDFCTVNVALNPENEDDVYIVATEWDSTEPADQFSTTSAVYIRGYGLTSGAKYYIKVEEKGGEVPLGKGAYTPGSEEVLFKLEDFAPFIETQKHSAEYFVSMSKLSGFPAGDDSNGEPSTIMDNFKIGSPVPEGVITVQIIEKIDGIPVAHMSPGLVGKTVILGREIKDQTAAETQYSDYLNDPSAVPALPLYTDEVKQIGSINSDGSVTWETPVETLKIGGYILLIDLEEGYLSNLDSADPDSDDGSLLKEVHLMRNDPVFKVVEINNYLE